MNSEIGTAETIEERKKNRQGRSTLTSGKGSKSGKNKGGGGGGNGGGGNNGGNNNFPPQNFNFREEQEQFKPDKFRIVMWFLLLVVVMTFGGLFSAYIVIATNGVAEWKPFNLPFQVWISTFLILVSSLTYKFSNYKLQNDNQTLAKKWLLTTTVLGATFISSQVLLWIALVDRGVYVRSNPYAGFFYILTAVHAIHVAVGIVALGYVVLRTWQETDSELELLRRKMISKVIGWYWHFMDALWIVLILLLGFWK